jgi:hypothetical protein
MTAGALEQLLARARGPMGPQIELDFGLAEGPFVELGAMLSRINGYFLFNAGVQVFRAGDAGLGPELIAWNTDTVWKDTYGSLVDDLFCFGQDLFGVQFGIYDNEDVVTLNPETGEMTALGPSLDDWATWLLEDPDVHGAASFAKAYQDANGPLEPDQRLIPLKFFISGGGYEHDNLVVREAATAMRIRGPIAQKVHDLPDGANLRIDLS